MEDNPHPLLRCTQPFIKKPGKPNNSYQSKKGEKNENNPEATTIPMVQIPLSVWYKAETTTKIHNS
jgi:hypothetical protein